VINTNLHPISHRFELIADYCLKFGKNGHVVFLSPLRGLGAAYAVHLRLIGKPVVTVEHFSVGVTAEALRANID